MLSAEAVGPEDFDVFGITMPGISPASAEAGALVCAGAIPAMPAWGFGATGLSAGIGMLIVWPAGIALAGWLAGLFMPLIPPMSSAAPDIPLMPAMPR